MSSELKLRAEVNENDKWNLAPLFSSDADWEKDFAAVKVKINSYSDFKGKLASSADTFITAIEFDLEVSRAIDRIYTYAHLKSDEDKTSSTYTAMLDRATGIYMKAGELSSYLSPEIQMIDEEKIKQFLSDSRIAPYAFYISKIAKYRPHTLSLETEEVLAASGEIADAASDIFGQLDNADFRYGKITNDAGKDEELTHGNFSRFLMSQNRDVRKNAFMQYYAVYESHKHALAAAYSSNCKKDRFYAKVRKFPSCRDSALFGDNVPTSVYDSLIAAAKSNIAPMVRYMDFRRKKLNLDDLHFYDTYVPLVQSVDFDMSYEEAVDTCVKALAVLGDEYCSILKEGLLGGWVDRYENRGKRSGAYSSGCYDSPPYILMNYDRKNINSLYTLIHEAGHSMHSHLSAKAQPFVYHRYTIFAAEVASTFNEILLSDYLLKQYADDVNMTAYILNREIDDIRATLYRQTMFAEFEAKMHADAENDVPITIDSIRALYHSLLQEYFGGSITIDPELELEALRIPHFYHAFYVYKYATGISAAASLAKRVIDGKSGAVESYLKFLSLGGSAYPIDELNVAGVDMSKGDAVNETLAYFAEIVDRFITTMEQH